MKARVNSPLAPSMRPEAGRACHDQGEGKGNLPGGPNPWVVQNPGTSCGKK